MSKFFPNCENSPGGRPYLKGLKSEDSSTEGAVGKIRDGKSVLSKFLNFNYLENRSKKKVKTSLADYWANGTAIEHFVNPDMTPTTDMRKVRINGDRTHLGRRNWDTIQSGFVIVSRRTYIVKFYHFDNLCKVENIFYWQITLVSCCDFSQFKRYRTKTTKFTIFCFRFWPSKWLLKKIKFKVFC